MARQANGKVNLSQPRAISPAVYKGIGDVLTRVYKDNGTRGLYRGVGESSKPFRPRFAYLEFEPSSLSLLSKVKVSHGSFWLCACGGLAAALCCVGHSF